MDSSLVGRQTAPEQRYCRQYENAVARHGLATHGSSRWRDRTWPDRVKEFGDFKRSRLCASQSNGLWRTGDGGVTWKVINAGWGAHNGGQLHRTADGVFFLADPAAGLLRSPDGLTWSLVPGVGSGMIGIMSSGKHLFASHGPYATDPAHLPYYTSAESDGQAWTQLASPLLSTGGYELAYNPEEHLLYSTNATAGFWRVAIE